MQTWIRIHFTQSHTYPVYFDDAGDCLDPFNCTDHMYTHETHAYRQLADLQGSEIPRYHGSFSYIRTLRYLIPDATYQILAYIGDLKHHCDTLSHLVDKVYPDSNRIDVNRVFCICGHIHKFTKLVKMSLYAEDPIDI